MLAVSQKGRQLWFPKSDIYYSTQFFFALPNDNTSPGDEKNIGPRLVFMHSRQSQATSWMRLDKHLFRRTGRCGVLNFFCQNEDNPVCEKNSPWHFDGCLSKYRISSCHHEGPFTNFQLSRVLKIVAKYLFTFFFVSLGQHSRFTCLHFLGLTNMTFCIRIPLRR